MPYIVLLALIFSGCQSTQTPSPAHKAYGPLGFASYETQSYSTISPTSLDLNLKKLGYANKMQMPGDRLYMGWGAMTVHND